MADLKTFLAKLNENLNILRDREAKYASNALLDLLNQISDHQKAIVLTEQAIADELSETDWVEALKPLLISLEAVTETTQIAIGSYIAQVIGSGTAIVNVYQQTSLRPIDPDELAKAQQRLASLPLDDIPASAPLPSDSRMPFSPNPLFVGREEELKELAKILKGEQTAAIGQIAAATGLGGIGKTQLASEFVHRYGQYFAGGVFWISFANGAAISTEITLCGGAGGLDLRPDFGNLPLEDQVRLVASAWQSELPRLLVFDNCEEDDLLAQWRPPTGGCRVLVTSRRGEWDTSLGVQALRLGVLSREKSVALLRKFRPNLEEDKARAIAEELGDLPLALHLAGSFLKAYQHDITPADYLAELQAGALLEHESLQGLDLIVSLTNHDLHVGRTFSLSYDRLQPNAPINALAMALLARAAHFAPGEPIPRDLLLTVDLPTQGAERRQASRALRRLVELGLLDTEADGALVLHRLLAAFARQATAATEPEAQVAVEKALLAEANRLNNAGYPEPLLAWQPHLRAMTDVAQTREDEQGAGLCTALGYHLQMMGDYVGARPYIERALVIREKVFEPDNPLIAQSLNELGALLTAMGDYENARSYFERALVLQEKVLEPDHPDIARSLNNLGEVLRKMWQLAKPLPYYERALAIREKVLGVEHPLVAETLTNMGFLFRAQGNLTRAQQSYERAFAIRQKLLGEDHPLTARSLNNLGFLLLAQGDRAQGQRLVERAIAIKERTLGLQHPSLARSLNALGISMEEAGDYGQAHLCFERALKIDEVALGPNHPSTLNSRKNLNRTALRLARLQGEGGNE